MFWEEQNSAVLLRIRLAPNAACRSVKGIFCDADGEEYLKIGVVSVAEKGKANRELVAMLAQCCGLSKSAITIAAGEFSHYKKILLKGDKQAIIEAVSALAGEKETDDSGNN